MIRKGELVLERKDRYEWVNALRGYAVLLVVLIHTSQQWYASNIIHFFADSGYAGVQLFFLMSAFTLFNSYSKRVNVDLGQVKKFFFLRRLFRIAPYYYVAGVMYMCWALFWNHTPVNFEYVGANFLFINGIYLPAVNYLPPGGWSVGVEMLFYLTIPALFGKIKSLRHAMYFFAIAMGLYFIFQFLAEHYLLRFLDGRSWADAKEWEFYFWLPSQLPVFALGIVLFFLLKEFKIDERMALTVLSLSVLFIVSLLFLSKVESFSRFEFPKHVLFSIGFLGVAVGLSRRRSIINNALIQNIGVVSFSIYLNHFMVLYIAERVKYRVTNFLHVKLGFADWTWDNDLVFIAAFASIAGTTYVISTYTYKYIENKGVRLGESLIEKLKRPNPS